MTRTRSDLARDIRFLLRHPYQEYDLSPVEESVAILVVRGWPRAAIARRLRRSSSTIRDTIRRICDKTGRHTRAQLVASFVRDIELLVAEDT